MDHRPVLEAASAAGIGRKLVSQDVDDDPDLDMTVVPVKDAKKHAAADGGPLSAVVSSKPSDPLVLPLLKLFQQFMTEEGV